MDRSRAPKTTTSGNLPPFLTLPVFRRRCVRTWGATSPPPAASYAQRLNRKFTRRMRPPCHREVSKGAPTPKWHERLPRQRSTLQAQPVLPRPKRSTFAIPNSTRGMRRCTKPHQRGRLRPSRYECYSRSKVRQERKEDVSRNNEAPHYCGASRVSMCLIGLTRTDRSISATTSQQFRLSRLERPGIEPGVVRCVRPTVDTIEAPQR